MENGGNLFGQGSRGHNGNNSNNSPNLAWDLWDFGTTFNDATTTTTSATAATSAAVATITLQETSAAHALMMFPHNFNNVDYFNHHQPPLLYGGSGTHLHPDPHLTCLKLGKRQYFEDAIVSASSGNLVGDRHVEVSGFSINGKRGRAYYNDVCGTSSSSAAVPATVPRCQVDGCHVALVNAKDYHRRHKVCEMHSKSPKVVVLGVEQRFCQQCSRFHAIAEFDDSKRSCRRRLAGHNERRRKSSHDSTAKNPSQDNKLMVGRYPYLASQTGRALSLLSSANKADSDHHHSWVSSADLSSRSSAALRELIAENRAAILAGQLILDNRDWHWHGHHAVEEINCAPTGSISHSYHHQLYNIEPPGLGLDRYHEHGRQITLDLMQASSSAFGMLSMRGKSKEEVEECSQLWNSLQGSHVV